MGDDEIVYEEVEIGLYIGYVDVVYYIWNGNEGNFWKGGFDYFERNNILGRMVVVVEECVIIGMMVGKVGYK